MSPPDLSASLDGDESIMIASFEGWNDAGSAASVALDHLVETWGATTYAELDSEEYHDFQVNRPTVSRAPSGGRVISWPGTIISTTKGPWLTDRQLTLVRGIEPSMRWRQFCNDILDRAEELGVTTILTCGSLMVEVPHTRPLPVHITSESPEMREKFSIDRANYEGPTGIIGVLAHEAHLRGFRVLALWAGVPHYIAHPPSPKASIALLAAIEKLIGEPIAHGDLTYEAEAWQRGADDLADEDDEIRDYVKQLEEQTDTAELPEASGDAIAAEFEQFLKRRNSGA